MKPIYITGYERSGTTLLRRLVSMHPALKYEIVHEHKRTFMSCETRSEALAKLTHKVKQAGEYTGAVASIKAGIKLPYTSFSEARSMCDKFTSMFPEGVILHIIRDPRRVINSQVRTFKRKPDECIVKYFKAWPRTMVWMSRKESIAVPYQHLVEDPADTLQYIYQYVFGEKLDQDILNKILTTRDPWKHGERVMCGLRYFDKVEPTASPIVLKKKHVDEIERRMREFGITERFGE
jgi:hypothetical protein